MYIFPIFGFLTILIFSWVFLVHSSNLAQGQNKQTGKQKKTATKSKQVSLSFRSSGNLEKLNIKLGSIVDAGQTLASLDQTDNLIALESIRAEVQAAASKLQKAKNGITQEELGVAQSTVETSRVALNNAKNNYQAVVSEQAVKVQDAYSTLLNSVPFVAVPSATNIGTTKLTISGSYTGPNAGTYKIALDNAGFSVSGLENWHSLPITTAGIPIAFGNYGLFATFSSINLTFLDSWTVTIPSTTSILYIKNYNAYQEQLQTQSKTVSSAQGAIDTAQAQYQQAQSQLALKQAGSRQEDIDVAQATLTIAQQKLRRSELTYSRNILFSPIKGKVVALKYSLGQRVPADTTFVIIEPLTAGRKKLF